MHGFVFLNDSIIPAEKARLPAVSSAALYGKGIFTTIAIRGGKPFLWDRHWQRLWHDAAKLGLHLFEYPPDRVAEALDKLIEKNKAAEGRARLTFFDERGAGAWEFDPERSTGLLIVTTDKRPIPEKLKLTFSPYVLGSGSPLAGIKSCNYLENLLALDEAAGRGFDEAIRLNERGEVAGASMANIFWKKEGRLFTPGLATGCLAGTTRSYAIEKFGAEEIAAGPGALDEAEEVILTSAGLGMICAEQLERAGARREYSISSYRILDE